MINAIPQHNPAFDGSLAATMAEVLRQHLREVDDMLPATVISFDRTAARAVVQPCIRMITTKGQQIERAQIASVPVLQIGGGGYFMSFPLNPGDFGFIKANDRDISAFLQYAAKASPPTGRIHSFSDGLFIPAKLFNFTIVSEDTENAVIQNDSGTVRIALFPDRVKITGLLTVEGEIRASGNILANRPMPEIVP